MKNIKEKLSAILSEDISGKNMRSIASNYSMFREWFYQPRTTNEASFEISKLTQNTMDEAFGRVQKKLKAFENRVLYPYFLEMRECMNSKVGKKKLKKEEDQEKTDDIIKQDSMNEDDETDEELDADKIKELNLSKKPLTRFKQLTAKKDNKKE